MDDPSFTTTQDPGKDELVVGGPIKVVEIDLTDHQAQGPLTRGAVLGYDAGGGNYGRVNGAAPFTAASAECILAKDADPSSGDVKALAYFWGDINENKINLGGAVTADDVRKAIQYLGIFLKKVIA